MSHKSCKCKHSRELNSFNLSDHGKISTEDNDVFFSPKALNPEIWDKIPDSCGKICPDFFHDYHGKSSCLTGFLKWIEPLLGDFDKRFSVVRIFTPDFGAYNRGIAFFNECGDELLSADHLCGDVLSPGEIMLGIDVPVDHYVSIGVNYGFTNPELFFEFEPVSIDFVDYLRNRTRSEDFDIVSRSKYFYAKKCKHCQPQILAFDSRFKDVVFSERYNVECDRDVCIVVMNAVESIRATEVFKEFKKKHAV